MQHFDVFQYLILKDSMESVEKDVEEFVNYLEQNNVVDHITNIFIMLYNESERPSDPIE
jgi:hypothetical protein